MEKTIKIGNKEYLMSSSAYTQFKYKNDTGRSLMQDLADFQVKYTDLLSGEETMKSLSQIDEIVETLLRIAFIMANERDRNQAPNFEDFLKQIDNYFEDTTWLNEVVELATSPFQRGISTNKDNQQ